MHRCKAPYTVDSVFCFWVCLSEIAWVLWGQEPLAARYETTYLTSTHPWWQVWRGQQSVAAAHSHQRSNSPESGISGASKPMLPQAVDNPEANASESRMGVILNSAMACGQFTKCLNLNRLRCRKQFWGFTVVWCCHFWVTSNCKELNCTLLSPFGFFLFPLSDDCFSAFWSVSRVSLLHYNSIRLLLWGLRRKLMCTARCFIWRSKIELYSWRRNDMLNYLISTLYEWQNLINCDCDSMAYVYSVGTSQIQFALHNVIQFVNVFVFYLKKKKKKKKDFKPSWKSKLHCVWV